MSDATFTFRVKESLKEQFTLAAKGRDRSGAQLLRDFMREFIQEQKSATEQDEWFRQQVQRGVDSANAGNLAPAADVEVKFAARRATTRSKFPASLIARTK